MSAGRPSPVEVARRRVCHLAESIGYLVTRTEDEGCVTLALFWMGATPQPHIRIIEIVPEGHGGDPWPLRERITRSGLAIPERITPSEVQRLLDLLAEFERSLSA